MRHRFVLAAAAAALSLAAQAHDYQAGGLRLIHPNTPAPVAGQDALGVYLAIENTSASPDRLLSATSDAARETSLHSMKAGAGGMHAAAGVDIRAKARVELSAQGPHIMLTGLERTPKQGDRIPLRLVFERAGAVQVEVVVGAAVPAKAGQVHDGH